MFLDIIGPLSDYRENRTFLRFHQRIIGIITGILNSMGKLFGCNGDLILHRFGKTHQELG